MSPESIKFVEEHPIDDCRWRKWMYLKGEKWLINSVLKDYFVNLSRYSGIKEDRYKLKFKKEHPKEYSKLSFYDVAISDMNERERAEYRGDLEELKKNDVVKDYISTKKWLDENKASATFVKGKCDKGKLQPQPL